MVMCLDTEECLHENQERERFCTNCNIPTAGSLLQGRYEIHTLRAKDRTTVTLNAIDRHTGKDVTVRVLRPRKATKEERAEFLQDAELALTFSSTMHEPGSICVTDFGEDGPVVFLVKSVMEEQPVENPSARPRMTVRVGKDVFASKSFPFNAQPEKPGGSRVKPAQSEPVVPISPDPASVKPVQSRWRGKRRPRL